MGKLGLKRGKVVLKMHQYAWARCFEEEKAILQKLLRKAALDIQHIGSTSIPNLPAKPIVDLLMGVRSLANVGKMQKMLEDIGYEYRENGSDDAQILFAKGPEEIRTHYLHITDLGSTIWTNDMACRN